MPETSADPSQAASEKPVTACPPSDPCDTRGEVLARKRKQIAAARDSFKSSREFLTRTQMSSSERLIRFYEGIIESLRGECFDSAYKEACHAFNKVVRYGLDVEITEDRRDRNDKLQDRLLILQAHHNIAVMNHRKWLAVTKAQLDPEPPKAGSTAEPRSAAELEKSALEAYKDAHLHYETVLVCRNPGKGGQTLFPTFETEKASDNLKSWADLNDVRARSALEGGYIALFLSSAFGLLELIVQGRLRWKDNATPAEPETDSYLNVAILFRLTSRLCELALAFDLWQRADNTVNRWHSLRGQIKRQQATLEAALNSRQLGLFPRFIEAAFLRLRNLFNRPDPLRLRRYEEADNKLRALEQDEQRIMAAWATLGLDLMESLNDFHARHIRPRMKVCGSIRRVLYDQSDGRITKLRASFRIRPRFADDARTLRAETDRIDQVLEEISRGYRDRNANTRNASPHEFMIDQKDFSTQIASRIRSELELLAAKVADTILHPQYQNVKSELHLTTIKFAFKRK